MNRPNLAAALATCALAALCQARARADVDFAKDIKPILEQSCLKCHSGNEPKGNLNLTKKQSALKGGDTGPLLVAGKADESSILDRITLPADDTGRMPNQGDPLKKEQIDLIRDWINQGANWPDDLELKPPMSDDPLNTPGLPVSDAERASVAKAQERGALAQRIAQNTNWLRVDFSLAGKDVKEEDLAILKDMANLVELDLGGTQVTGTCLEHVKGLTNLMRLHLEKTKVTDAALEHLKSQEKLSYLNLYGTEITDAGLEHLAGLKGLKKLYLWQTKVTDDGAKKLQAALPDLKINRGLEAEAAAAAKPEEKKEEPKKEEPKKEEAKKDEPKKEAAKKDEPKKEEPKKEEPKKDEAKKDKPKKEEAKKDEPKKEEPKKDDSKEKEPKKDL